MDVLEKFRRLKAPSRKWNRKVFGDIEFNSRRLEEELAPICKHMDVGSLDEVDIARFRALKNHLDHRYERKCCNWKQMSIERGIKDVDRNSKFFSCNSYKEKKEETYVENEEKTNSI